MKKCMICKKETKEVFDIMGLNHCQECKSNIISINKKTGQIKYST